ncbi:heavy metal-associated isoprenylated plant protein 22-like [Olea europaea var. sylvestris]|uniref:heavy metal-associated isoprenylated plant protein 22-like n=1 Tax=Olea europaea var. sylvestris TaxID=158386 RepID=UPI000C1CCF4C|nr:heavy metal-associated isoprenylated plant protein 22-like [Olea europaea var. sylvestris]
MEHANLSCILKVNTRCDACKRKTLEILNSICGVYSVTFNAEEGVAKIMGEVDPNLLLAALARTGQHAELVWAKLDHPRIDRGYYNDHDYRGEPYRHHQRALPEYFSNNPNYYDATPLPYYEDQSTSFCTIM